MDASSIFPLFDTWTGWMMVVFYGLVVFGLTKYYASGYDTSKTKFLLANREIGAAAGSLSLAAVWTWAPALFISAQMAYVNGVVGLFWFTIGNFLTLILFGYFAKIVRDRHPNGFTLAGYLREKFSNRVQGIFLIELWMLATCAFAINVLAGSKSIEILTGINYHIVTLALAAIALAYAFRGGLRASLVTEVFKIAVIYFAIVAIIPWAWSSSGGFENVIAGLGGMTGQGTHIVGTEFALGVFMAMGISTALGHLGAPWGDNGFYQRIFAIEPSKITIAFISAAFIFLAVPLSFGSLGFMAAGMGLEIPRNFVDMTTVIAIGSVLPNWVLIIITFVILAGLVAVLDAQLSSASSLFGHDIKGKFAADSKHHVWWSRAGMILLIAMALIIANWPGITLMTIFLFFGVMRATVWWPLMLHLWNDKLITERGMFWGILIGFFTGFPMFVYGQQIVGSGLLTMTGTLIAVFGSGAMAYLISRLDERKLLTNGS